MILHIRRRHVVGALCATVLAVCVAVASLPNGRQPTDGAAREDGIPVVTVDAGHGGFDGGAIAADGTKEKDVNLQIALPLADLLRLCGMRVQTTRESDNALCEKEKASIREKKVADMKERLRLFETADVNVSIHQNSFAGASSSGTQMFYSVNHPASERLALSMRERVVEDLQPENTRSIKSGGRDIYLLYHATTPTVLVECGFLTNAAEREALVTPTYQRRMAWSLGMGIVQYVTAEQGGTTT